MGEIKQYARSLCVKTQQPLPRRPLQEVGTNLCPSVNIWKMNYINKIKKSIGMVLLLEVMQWLKVELEACLEGCLKQRWQA